MDRESIDTTCEEEKQLDLHIYSYLVTQWFQPSPKVSYSSGTTDNVAKKIFAKVYISIIYNSE